MKIPQDYISYFAGFGPITGDLYLEMSCTISAWSPSLIEQRMIEQSNHEIDGFPPEFLQFATSEGFAYAFDEHGAVFAFMNFDRAAHEAMRVADSWNEFFERMGRSENLIVFSMPSLFETLSRREKFKGSPLTKAEVNQIGEDCRWVAVAIDDAPRIEEARGYQDIDPERCWVEWQEFRKRLAEESRKYLTIHGTLKS
jgi:hypothetical protein